MYCSCSVHRSPCPENYVSERVACLRMCIHPEQKSDREKPSFQNAMCFCRLLCLQCWWSQLFTQSLAQLKVSERCPAVCNCLLFLSFFLALKDLGTHSVVTKQIRFVFADLKTLQSIMNLERPSHYGLKACSKLLKDHLGVSKNNGTPKSSILIGFSIINHPFWKHPFRESHSSVCSWMPWKLC